MPTSLNFAVLTSSDSGYSGQRVDIGGDAVVEAIQAEGHNLLARAMLPDDRDALADQICSWADSGDVHLIFTTGGTGMGPRDVMPEAMEDALDYDVPGIPEAMRSASLDITPMAMLSRARAGVRNRTLIVNLPGSPRGAVQTLEVVLPVLRHAVEIVRGEHRGEHPANH